ncbi:MAG: hypothetical protein H6633_27025 [Anaerolineales bacterium]|nr:hypothetical protein [Anaerolineales bacterium]
MNMLNTEAWLNSISRLSRIPIVLLLGLIFLGLTFTVFRQSPALAQPQTSSPARVEPLALPIGDLVSRIQCTAGYTAYLYTDQLVAPHGLAFGPDGYLYAAEESPGRVSRIDPNGAVTPILTGLTGPEGIAFDGDGNMYVVEDVDEGRVVKKVAGSSATSGTTLAGGLDAPEDIIWVDNGGDGTLYLTESNLEHAIAISSTVPAEYRTHVTEVSLSGVVTRLLTTTADINLVFNFPNPPSVDATFWSYTSLTANGSNLLYVANELSGKQLSGSYSGVPYTADSTEAIFVVDPTAATPSATAFTNGADDAIAPEGVNFGDGDAFPLYVAEEDISNDDSGVGRLSQIDATGNRTDFCTGFSTVEDVVFDENGWLYVSEDGNGTVIQIRPDSPPDPAPDDEFVWLPILIR